MKRQNSRDLHPSALLALALSSFWPSQASAEPARPTLTDLPAASLTSLSALSAPDQVQRTSSNLPFSVTLPEERKAREEAAKKKKRKLDNSSSYASYEHRLTLEAKSPETCLASVDSGASARVENRDHLHLQRYKGYRPRVQTVRAERLLTGKEPRLLVEDFFVDVETDHVKRAGKKLVPLLPVARDTQGFAIYAFREHHRVNLVLSAPGAAMVGPTTSATQLGCGIRRVSLPNDARNGVAMSFALGLPNVNEPELVDNFQPYQQVPMQRAVRVSVSLSQTSRDPAPVLSVTVGRPNRPIQNALKGALPRWTDVLGTEGAQQLHEKLSRL